METKEDIENQREDCEILDEIERYLDGENLDIERELEDSIDDYIKGRNSI